MQQAAIRTQNNLLDIYVKHDIRCVKCNCLLLKVNENEGSPKKIEIKCKKCKYINKITI